MRGTSRREDHAFSVIRLDEVQDDGERRNGARFVMRFTKNRNSATDLGATEWSFQTLTDGNVKIATKQAEGSAGEPDSKGYTEEVFLDAWERYM
jgi:hypothetical protein